MFFYARLFCFCFLYAFLCLIKLIMILRVLTFTDKTYENKILTSYYSLVYTSLRNVQSEDFIFLCFVSMCVWVCVCVCVCVCVKSFCKKNKEFKTALMTSFILLLRGCRKKSGATQSKFFCAQFFFSSFFTPRYIWSSDNIALSNDKNISSYLYIWDSYITRSIEL